jgi:hypothetical protein
LEIYDYNIGIERIAPVCSIASEKWSTGSVLMVTMGDDTECWGWSCEGVAARMMVGCLVMVNVLVVMVVTVVVIMGSTVSISGISVLITGSCVNRGAALLERSKAWLLPKNSQSKSANEVSMIVLLYTH